MTQLPASFWDHVEVRPTGCWVWTAARNNHGYGKVVVGGRRLYAHRLSYEASVGDLIPGMVIDHLCQNPPCIRPEHLQQVTQLLNMQNHSGPKKSSKSGVRGVWFDRRTKHWVGQVTLNRQRYWAGSHATLDEAAEAVLALRNSLFTNNPRDRRAA